MRVVSAPASTSVVRAAAPRGSRLASASATSAPKKLVRKGRKGHLYGVIDQPGTTPEEQIQVLRRRIEKAERDERMDIALSLKPVKTCVACISSPRFR
jgi:hypothetical protein